ncbi:MAG: hypothetical protein V5A68_01345 [Candidatus Thermoplasmatota archaeon]
MEKNWIKCSCGSEKFKIDSEGKIFCVKCMKPLKKTEINPDHKKVKRPKTPFDIDHPDIKGPYWF